MLNFAEINIFYILRGKRLAGCNEQTVVPVQVSLKGRQLTVDGLRFFGIAFYALPGLVPLSGSYVLVGGQLDALIPDTEAEVDGGFVVFAAFLVSYSTSIKGRNLNDRFSYNTRISFTNFVSLSLILTSLDIWSNSIQISISGQTG